jgi:hypothetical protein
MPYHHSHFKLILLQHQPRLGTVPPARSKLLHLPLFLR